MTNNEYKTKLQEIVNKIAGIENDPVVQRVKAASLTCSEVAYEDLNKFYDNYMQIDALMDELHEIMKIYYKNNTPNCCTLECERNG